MSNNECEISPTYKDSSNTSLTQIIRPSNSKCSSIWSQECCSSNLSYDLMEPYASDNLLSKTFGRCKNHRRDVSSAKTVNAIMQRRPSVLNMKKELQVFGHGLNVLEPRPLIYWGSMEETMSLV
ncbi:hypothetical protein HI914_01987 [Erysiphe necator]|nr:hypothetical protein HI914_01987 [Erysiphe necator]